MILPTTYLSALLLLIASMLCWGSWANTQKLAGKWRFELFYYDYSIGVLLCALIAAFTLGQLAPKELTFTDNFLIASKRQMAWGVGAGVVFNLANMLLVAAISVSGMAVAFPIAIGLALVIGVVWNHLLNPQGSPILLFGGVSLVLVAILVDAFAYSAYTDAKRQAAVKAATLQPDPRIKKFAPSGPGAGRGILLSIFGGILMGVFYPMVEMSREGDSGVSPYGIGILFAAGVLVSSLFYIPFFLTFPVSGPPVEVRQYLAGTKGQHLLGLSGGVIWMAGALCNFAAASTPPSVHVGPAVSYALGQGATLVSALWGLLVWHEFKGAAFSVKLLLFGMIVLFLTGLGMISIAPLYGS
jgi:glucose uptake protein